MKLYLLLISLFSGWMWDSNAAASLSVQANPTSSSLLPACSVILTGKEFFVPDLGSYVTERTRLITILKTSWARYRTSLSPNAYIHCEDSRMLDFGRRFGGLQKTLFSNTGLNVVFIPYYSAAMSFGFEGASSLDQIIQGWILGLSTCIAICVAMQAEVLELSYSDSDRLQIRSVLESMKELASFIKFYLESNGSVNVKVEQYFQELMADK